MKDKGYVLKEEAERKDLVDELRPASYGLMPQSEAELREAFDPYASRLSDFLLENK